MMQYRLALWCWFRKDKSLPWLLIWLERVCRRRVNVMFIIDPLITYSLFQHLNHLRDKQVYSSPIKDMAFATGKARHLLSFHAVVSMLFVSAFCWNLVVIPVELFK